MANKTTIPVLRHLARSGGTIISRCIGSMTGVVLLSEIHPNSQHNHDPAGQAMHWFGLLTEDDMHGWSSPQSPPLLEVVALCEQRARTRGDRLVLRDWSHLDYIGTPYIEPHYRFSTRAVLSDTYDIAEAITVRHPLDQFLSMLKLKIMRETLRPEPYLKGCAAFAKHAAETGFVRYEDFTSNPETALRDICTRLGLDYDPTCLSSWPDYTTITGDRPGAGSRRSDAREIKPLPRPIPPAGLIEHFQALPDYQLTCELLGYEP